MGYVSEQKFESIHQDLKPTLGWYRGCTESNCTGVIFICFHQFILPTNVRYDLEMIFYDILIHFELLFGKTS